MTDVISETMTEEDDHHIVHMREAGLLSDQQLEALGMIYPGMRQRSLLNAFRDIRTKLLQRAGGRNFVLLVSQLGEHSADSFAALNIAASFAMDERKSALFVDCNLEQPSSHRFFASKPEAGLSDYLEDESLSIDSIIHNSGVPRMRIVPVGNSYSTTEEQYASARMKELMEQLRDRYHDRFIVVDVPPVGTSVVARIISQLVDFSVLVVPYGQVTPQQVLSGIDAVGHQRFAGLVFNE